MKRRTVIYAALLMIVQLLLSACGGDTPGTQNNATPLTANAGTAQSVPTGTVVTLNGSVSSDPYGMPLTYTWSFTSRPVGSGATFSDVNATAPTFTADVPGTYIVQLVVSNGTASSAPATVTITVNVTTTIHELVTNGSFESGILGWNYGFNDEGASGGSCSYAGASGVSATDGTKYMAGSVSSPGKYNCVLYQDIAIPAYTTDLTLTFDIRAVAEVGSCRVDSDAFVGLFSTAAIPGTASSFLGGAVAESCTDVPGTALTTMTKSLNPALLAGTTVRLAFINAAGNGKSQTIAIDNVRLTATVTH